MGAKLQNTDALGAVSVSCPALGKSARLHLGAISSEGMVWETGGCMDSITVCGDEDEVATQV